MIGIETVVWVVIYVLVAGAIFGLLFWLVSFVNPPEPFNRFARIFLAVCMVLVLIGILLGLIGHPLIRWGPP